MVHDSDIACYWLYDGGKLLDEFNSCPDYFDDDGGERGAAHRRQTDVLVRFCRTGVTEDQLTEILARRPTFAESIVERLADALGSILAGLWPTTETVAMAQMRTATTKMREDLAAARVAA